MQIFVVDIESLDRSWHPRFYSIFKLFVLTYRIFSMSGRYLFKPQNLSLLAETYRALKNKTFWLSYWTSDNKQNMLLLTTNWLYKILTKRFRAHPIPIMNFIQSNHHIHSFGKPRVHLRKTNKAFVLLLRSLPQNTMFATGYQYQR